jgi:hypothetical protein
VIGRLEKTVIDCPDPRALAEFYWPDPAYPQQMRLDIRVSDAGQAEQELLALGATRVPGERETGFRVFTDPAGHPFCIVFGHHSTD